MSGIKGEVFYNEDGSVAYATGGKAAAIANKAKDPDHYRKIALKAQESWAKNGRKPRGFAFDPEKARVSGAKGGAISRRGSGKGTYVAPQFVPAIQLPWYRRLFTFWK